MQLPDTVLGSKTSSTTQAVSGEQIERPDGSVFTPAPPPAVKPEQKGEVRAELEPVAELPAVKLDGEPMNRWEQFAIVAGHWFTEASETIRDLSESGVATAQPESWSSYRARVAKRGWLPDGYSGGWLERVPLAVHYTVGPVGFVLGHAIVWVATRPLALCFAVLLAVAITVGHLISN